MEESRPRVSVHWRAAGVTGEEECRFKDGQKTRGWEWEWD